MQVDATAVSEWQDAATPGRYSSAKARLYFWVIVGIPFLALVLSFPLMSSAFFEKYGDTGGVSSQKSLFETSNYPCEVLMYGDSTAEAGLDPAIVEKVTHLSACNISTGGTTLGVLGMEPFNQYLTRNPKPRYLVFQFSSPNLNEFKPGVAFLDHFDGIIQSLRYYSWGKTLPLFLHNPDYFFGMLNYTYRSGLTEMVLAIRGKRPKPDEKHRDSYLIYPRPPLESCPIYNGGDAMPSQAWVAYLRQHYGALAEHVLVDVSPTSPCAVLYSQWKAHLGHATDNELELYPNHLFVDGTFHLSREGAIRRSNELAEQILQAENQRNAAGASNPSGGNEAPAGGEKD